MKRINPEDFSGPRAYFTDFDSNIVRLKGSPKEYERDVERRLKILLLTKNTIVCAASHLNHEFSYNILKRNPVLLNSKMILPALRTDKLHVTDYFNPTNKSDSKIKEMSSFFEENVNSVVDWDLMDNSTWFKDNLLEALKDEKSVLRRNLVDLPNNRIDVLIDSILQHKVLYRDTIIEHVSDWTLPQQKRILDFTNLVYHMSGARVVNCESNLPTENYIDYSSADYSKNRTILSDTQVFSKIFFDLVFEVLNKNSSLPVEMLDFLSFEDIFELRKPISESSFTKKYDDLIKKSVLTIQNPDINVEELNCEMEKSIEIIEDIKDNFRQVFLEELGHHLEYTYNGKKSDTIKSSMEFGESLVGYVPILSNVANILSAKGTILSFRDIVVNLNQVWKTRKQKDDYNIYLENKKRTLYIYINKYQISEKKTFLDTWNLLQNVMKENTTL